MLSSVFKASRMLSNANAAVVSMWELLGGWLLGSFSGLLPLFACFSEAAFLG